MTGTDKPVTRRTIVPRASDRRKIVVTLGPGDVIGFRLEREPDTRVRYLRIANLFEQADRAWAAAQAGFDPSPCKNPAAVRNV